MHPHPSRRSVLLSTVALVTLVASVRAPAARVLSGAMPWAPSANAPAPTFDEGFLFFSANEVAFMDAMLSRLIPADGLGGGAREAGVTVFLDRQLAGSYGRAESWYMEGPWNKGTKTQGYQSQLSPAQLYRTAIQAIDEHCRARYEKKPFNGLSPDQQDEVITALEKGTLKVPGVGPESIEIEGAESDSFFAVLMQNAIEGFFSDPLYGGNKNFIGWKLIGFPGARYDYRPYISKHGERLALEPLSIMGRPGWRPDHT